MSQSIWKNAVCLSIAFHRPGITRKLNDSEYETAAKKTVTRASKTILDSVEYKRVGSLDSAFKTWLRAMALPCEYMRGGMFPIALATVELIDKRIEEFENERLELIDAFMSVYSDRINDMRSELKSLFNGADYLSEDEMREAFRVDRQYVSFDTPSNLKELSDGFFQREKSKTEQRLNEAADSIEHAMAESMAKMVDHLHDRLIPSPDGKQKILTESAMNHVLDFLETFRVRNITDDEALLAVVEKAETVRKDTGVKRLRKSAEARKSISDGLAEVGEQLGTLITSRGRKVIL